MYQSFYSLPTVGAPPWQLLYCLCLDRFQFNPGGHFCFDLLLKSSFLPRFFPLLLKRECKAKLVSGFSQL